MPRQIRETFRPDMPNRTYFTPPRPRGEHHRATRAPDGMGCRRPAPPWAVETNDIGRGRPWNHRECGIGQGAIALTVHRSQTVSMTRRPRPPPATRSEPLPFTAKRCTETSSSLPSPEILKLPPPYLAKLGQLNDQTRRQPSGTSNSPP